jgi:hypothetical protein
MIFRAIKEGGENAASLATQDLDYLFKINEYLDIQDYFESDIQKQIERQNK